MKPPRPIGVIVTLPHAVWTELGDASLFGCGTGGKPLTRRIRWIITGGLPGRLPFLDWPPAEQSIELTDRDRALLDRYLERRIARTREFAALLGAEGFDKTPDGFDRELARLETIRRTIAEAGQ